jgi:hypothetical protein
MASERQASICSALLEHQVDPRNLFFGIVSSAIECCVDISPDDANLDLSSL